MPVVHLAFSHVPCTLLIIVTSVTQELLASPFCQQESWGIERSHNFVTWAKPGVNPKRLIPEPIILRKPVKYCPSSPVES